MKAYSIDGLVRGVLGVEEFSWKSVTSLRPQRSVLSLLLFVILVNDLPEGLINK